MTRLASVLVVLGWSAAALADTAKGPAPEVPKVGDTLGVQGAAPWPKLEWLYDVPSARDAAGKVIVHWFCTPKTQQCTDDLARLVTLREGGHTYVVAYINGTKTDAKKLDPIRESEGVGHGTVAFGKNVATLMKAFSAGAGPMSVVVDLDGKVTFVAPNGSPETLDARDAKVNALIGAIKEFTSSSDAPKTAEAGEKFPLTLTIKLASWLTYSKNTPAEFKVSVPPDFKCDATTLTGDQLKIANNVLTATVNCTAPRGIYEARGDIRFGYASPTGATGFGNDGAKWRVEVKP